MTKFILVGGYMHKAPDKGASFIRELVKDIKNKPVKILVCLFAVPEEAWAKKFADDQAYFSQIISDFTIELADKSKFIEQLKNADVLYLRGGQTKALFDSLQATPEWINCIEGKTVAGASAGANVLARYNYSLDSLFVRECFGILPIKFISHWQSDYNAPNIDWDKAYQELKDYKEDLEIITLREGEFKVITKDRA